MATNLKGLQNFQNKLNKYSVLDINKIAEIVAENGIEIAKNEYAGTTIKIDKELLGNGESKIIANGKQVAYMEYGIGLVGNGTYPKDKLPKQPITFESPKKNGDIHTTQGWEYFYPNEKTKINGGWYLGKRFTRGNPAQAQMFNTAKKLADNISSIINNEIKGSGK